MKSIVKTFLTTAGLLGLPLALGAQTITTTPVAIVGSSALYLESGLAASASTAHNGLGAVCVWNTTASNIVRVKDTSTGSSIFDTGASWIAWTPGTGTCASPSSGAQVYLYVNTDSVVGNRALDNSDTIQPGASADPTTTSSSATIVGTGGTSVSLVPSNVWANLNGATVNTAATDIRPEDAEFAITRALTPCGTAINQYTGATPGFATQYLGLGYTNGSVIHSFYSTSAFNVINFSLPSSFAVVPVGATPIVVAVNTTDASNTGFNTSAIKNLNRSTMALFLDGSISQTQDALDPTNTPSGYTSTAVTTIVREPLSGTYNTMEYNIPNSVELQTSQDVGSAQPSATQNCSGTSPQWNSQGTSMAALGGGARNRAIGTGQELNALFGTGGLSAASDGLGYAFWSAANFASAPASSHYLQIDGVDPLKASYTNGTIPTSSNGLLGNVTLVNVANGSYPIWSLLRFVTKGSTSAPATVSNLAAAAQNFVNASEPDFVPFNNSTYSAIPVLAVERAHFTPPGIYASGSAPAPQNFAATGTEVGGDVGGMVVTYNVDADYAVDVNANGFTGTTAPTSLRRN